MTDNQPSEDAEQQVQGAIRRIDYASSPDRGDSDGDATRTADDPAADGPASSEETVSTVTPAIRRISRWEDEGSEDPFAGDDTRSQVLREVREAFEAGRVDGPFETPDDEFIGESFFDFSYLEDHEEVERYWVHEPFAYVSILYDEIAREYRYHVTEPTLDTFEEYVRQDLVTLLRNSLMYFDFDEDGESERERVFIQNATDLIDEHAATVEDGTLHKVLYFLRRDFVHYGPIDPIMADQNIEDISCDGIDVPVFVYHREYRDLRTNVRFGKRQLTSFTVRLAQQAGKQLSVSNPLADASLPDGSRIQLTMGGDVSTRGANFTIRKFADIPYTPVDLVNWNTFSTPQMAYFWLAIENNKSLVFAGGTGSGKTTSMNAVSFFIPPASKVVTIEDTREIDLPHDNWVQSVTRSSASGEGRGEVSMYNLLQAALRQRPEYILVGEIRTEQRVALTFFQAMGTGHTAYTTIHADSAETVLSRLQNPPLSIPTQMLQDLDVVAIQRQTFIGDRRVRRSAGVYELFAEPTDPDQIGFRRIFEWVPETDRHERLEDSSVLAEIAHDRGWSDEQLSEELERRERVISFLVDNDVTGYADVAGTIHMYAKDPEFVLAAIDDPDVDPVEMLAGVTVGGADGWHHDPDRITTPEDRSVWEQLVQEAGDEAAHLDPPTDPRGPDSDHGSGDDDSRDVDGTTRSGPGDGDWEYGEDVDSDLEDADSDPEDLR